MELNSIARVLQTRWKSIVSMILLALTVAAVISVLTPKQYESTAKIYLAVDTSQTDELYASSIYVAARLKSYSSLAEQRQFLNRVIDDLALDESPEALARKVTVSAEPETVILSFTVRDGNPEQARQIADTGASQLGRYIEELETPRGAVRPALQATVTDPPIENNDPVAPRVVLNLALAGFIGVILGIGLAATREVLDTSVREVGEVEEEAGVPVMASVATDSHVSSHPIISASAGFSQRSEAFGLLRTNLQFADPDARPRSVVITSPVAGEGKTQVAVNLAVAMANAGQSVIVVDCDLRRPKIAPLLGVDGTRGLITVLVDQTPLEEVIQLHKASGVHVLAGGPTPPNPSEILQTGATRELLAKLRAQYDAVIIDAPPVLPVADATILATASDGVLIVARHGKTQREELRRAAGRLRSVGGNVIGVVLNMVPAKEIEGHYAEDGIVSRRKDK